MTTVYFFNNYEHIVTALFGPLLFIPVQLFNQIQNPGKSVNECFVPLAFWPLGDFKCTACIDNKPRIAVSRYRE